MYNDLIISKDGRTVKGVWNRAIIKHAIIPEGVTNIMDFVFWGCPNLKSISIPDSVTNIGPFFFHDCI